MKVNVGGADKILRILAGLALLSLTMILDSPNRWWGLVGLLPLLTGTMGYCPAYTLFGISTSKDK
jgi:hypothetical protein